MGVFARVTFPVGVFVGSDQVFWGCLSETVWAVGCCWDERNNEENPLIQSPVTDLCLSDQVCVSLSWLHTVNCLWCISWSHASLPPVEPLKLLLGWLLSTRPLLRLFLYAVIYLHETTVMGNGDIIFKKQCSNKFSQILSSELKRIKSDHTGTFCFIICVVARSKTKTAVSSCVHKKLVWLKVSINK